MIGAVERYGRHESRLRPVELDEARDARHETLQPPLNCQLLNLVLRPTQAVRPAENCNCGGATRDAWEPNLPSRINPTAPSIGTMSRRSVLEQDILYVAQVEAVELGT